MLLREVLTLALLGTAVGVATGLVLAGVFTRGLEDLYGLRFPRAAPTLSSLAPAIALGPGMALLAVVGPARRAGRREPLDGLLDERGGGSAPVQRWTIAVGLLLVLATLGIEVGLIQGWMPAGSLAPAIAILMTGCVLALPLALPVLAWAASLCLRPFFGPEGRLALKQVDRHGVRTSLTVGVLFVATVVGVGMGNSIWNRIRDLNVWAERTLVEDYFVRSVLPETGTSLAATVPESVGDDIARLPGAGRVSRIRFVPARVDGMPVVVLAKEFARDRPLPLDLVEGDPEDALLGLARGEVVLGIVPAHRAGRHAGDLVTLDTKDGPKRLRVAGVTNEYTVGGSAVYVDWAVAKSLFGFEGADAFPIQADPARRAEFDAALRRYGAEKGLLVHSNAEFRRAIDRMTDGVVGVLWALLAFVFVVASCGIVNTLTMNVLEKTRELGLLRAVAMSRRQVRRMILAESLAMGLVGGVPGAAVGLGLAYMMNLVIGPLEGHPVPFRVLPVLVVGCFLAAVVVAVLSALLPARRAARLEIVQALQYE
jgi:putative ABC transport system permease protein